MEDGPEVGEARAGSASRPRRGRAAPFSASSVCGSGTKYAIVMWTDFSALLDGREERGVDRVHRSSLSGPAGERAHDFLARRASAADCLNLRAAASLLGLRPRFEEGLLQLERRGAFDLHLRIAPRALLLAAPSPAFDCAAWPSRSNTRR